MNMGIIEQLSQGITTHSAQETQDIASQLALALPIDNVLALYGDLGSGKTTFVQGLAHCWGIREPVTSPTYAIFNSYTGTRKLIHLDAYRLDSNAEADDLMLEDFLESPWCLAIEWPENMPDLFNSPAWKLQFERATDKIDTVTISLL